MLKDAKRLLKKQGCELSHKGVIVGHKASCGCVYDLYDNKTGTGLIIDGGRVCSMQGGHGAVYQPSVNLVLNGDAIQMFETLMRAMDEK